MLKTTINTIKKENPANLMARHFDFNYFDGLAKSDQQQLQKIICSGLQNPESQMGVYAREAGDYSKFDQYLDKIICDYHGIEHLRLKSPDWNISNLFDLSKIDKCLANSSMRVRVGRNVAGFPLPASMSKADRISFEDKMIAVFEKLIKNPNFGGRYFSLTPGSHYEIGALTYQQLVAEHKMFKNMSGDAYLDSAGISSDWPYGRGMYISHDEQFIIWVGEEDHLRVMVMKHGKQLNEIFDRLNSALVFIETHGLVFSYHPPYGFITSCPTNLGTAMRASLHIALPKLTKNGQDLTALKHVAKELQLSVRGADGEHSEAGKGGVVDISPTARLMVTESEIVARLYEGVEALWAAEMQCI
jgi:creatine kinase